MEKQLTDKQEIFCYEYAVDFNATRAYLVAYPNVIKNETARSNGSRLLTNANIQNRIKELQTNLAETTGVTRLRVVNELKKIAFTSIAHFHKEWIERADFDELTDNQKSAIESIDTRVMKRQTETGEHIEVEQIKIKLFDKHKAIEIINKMLGYNEPEKIEHSGEIENKTTILVQDQRTASNVDKLMNDNN